MGSSPTVHPRSFSGMAPDGRGNRDRGPLAQLVEQLTLNQLVVGSSPTRPTTEPPHVRNVERRRTRRGPATPRDSFLCLASVVASSFDLRLRAAPAGSSVRGALEPFPFEPTQESQIRCGSASLENLTQAGRIPVVALTSRPGAQLRGTPDDRQSTQEDQAVMRLDRHPAVGYGKHCRCRPDA